MSFTFNNNESKAVTIIVEPWVEEFVVSPGSILDLNIFYTKIGVLETEISPKYFTIWLWAGCHVEVSLDGKDQTPPHYPFERLDNSGQDWTRHLPSRRCVSGTKQKHSA